ncbi:type II secretion system minor pseudopilin GspH [Paraburkholderia sp. BCC1876]|uniref:type II secretion system minor pseudopilin GspH n=1 Tax=Paraburkholderia sp. BCC1876 TaxID=2676303 RepID=UPI001591471A|nr:type II secretion system minor pseudopilin GspH [Paraburkholderia sp. BCC1876]
MRRRIESGHIARPLATRLTRPARHTQRGFTLLEMMVVLLIVGLLVAVVTLAPSRNRRTDLAEEAQRLASLLESAGDEAQVRSSPMAWQPIAGGYRFYRRTEDGAWKPVADDLFGPHRWSTEVTGVSVRYTGSNEPVSRVVFGDESIGVPVTITLSSEGVRLLVVGTGIGNFVVRRP